MKSKLLIIIFIITCTTPKAQLKLDSILNEIQNVNPQLKMYDADIRSLDEAAKGAKSWMAPEISSGFWMTPYKTSSWKKQSNGATGMGQYMISGQQTIPNPKRLNADAKYMESMSAVDKQRKNAALNELNAEAKKNYYEWMIIKKKISILDQNERLIDFMIKNAELRYKNGLGKISAYYKAKAAVGNIMNMKIMLENDIKQKQFTLNTLMFRDKELVFDIDTSYSIKDFTNITFDSATFINTRSDIKAIENDIQVTYLKQNTEKARLLPEFGIQYGHMFGFGGSPPRFSLMGMVRLPMAGWSSKMNKANIQSLKWKAEALGQQRQMIINEATGMASRMANEIASKKKQIKLYEDNIIPALRRNYQSMQLGYEQNTEELFMLFDAWETLNMTQLEYTDQLQQLLQMQVELERVLEIR
ncbi:MAG: TolC family protein [Ginsengibacter sp.]